MLNIIDTDDDNQSIRYKNTQNKSQIVFAESLNKTFNSEKANLTGFKERHPKREYILNYKKNVKLQDESVLFKQTRELLKKVNPIAFKIERQNNELDSYFLKKKLEMKYIRDSKMNK